MPSYEPTGSDLAEMVAETMEKYHPDLLRHEVAVNTLFATTPLKHHGWPASAIVKINGPDKRAKGDADATIYIQKDTWEDMTEPEQVALLDHEFHHLVVRLDKEKKLMTDDRGRPLLRMRPHDYECGVFKVIIDRHKDDAPDFQAVKVMTEGLRQKTFTFAEAS